jgi:glycosyltransferase involved in cell wall biosynthesis
MITLDILIPCRNEDLYLDTLINSFQNLIIPKNLSVRYIFSDNASTDGTHETLKNSKLENKIVYLQEKNNGGYANFNFLLNKIEADYFMFIDGHDYLSKFYLENFCHYVNLHSSNTAFIGDVITLQEIKGKFYPVKVQKRYQFSKISSLRNLQLSIFLLHNSIYHSIYPTKQINMEVLTNAKSWSIDHLITHAGFANCELKYLDKAFYVRRYREIIGDDFSHNISGEIISRRQRGLGESTLIINDNDIANEIISVTKFKNNLIVKILIRLLINGKFSNSYSGYFFYRVSRFISNKFLRINPSYLQNKSISKEIYDEVTKLETFKK